MIERDLDVGDSVRRLDRYLRRCRFGYMSRDKFSEEWIEELSRRIDSESAYEFYE